MFEYTYTKTAVNFKKLETELLEASLNIYEYYKKVGNSFTFYSDTAWSGAQQTQVGNVIANHNPSITLDSSSTGLSQTTSSNYQTKIEFMEYVETKRYYLNWYYEFNNSTTSNDFQGRVRIDNTVYSEINVEMQDSSSYYPCSGRIPVDLTEGFVTLALEYSRESGGTSRIRNAYLYLEEA